MKKWWWLLLLLNFPVISADLFINEVMYDPGQCSDTACEWIELFNSGEEAVNLTGCFLEGKGLSGTVPGYGFLTAVRKSANFTQFFGPVENMQEISFSLGNGGDHIELNGTSFCNETFDYTPLVDFAAGNNKTLERNNEGWWGESKPAGGTPGRENSIANVSFDDLTLVISEVLANPWENDDWPAPDGEWIELLNYGEREIYAGGLKITDANGENELWIASSSLAGDIFVLPGEYLVVYRNGDADFSLNNNGYEEVRLVQELNGTDVLIDFMSYSGTTEGMSWSNVEGEWYETAPTPLDDNEYTGECIWGLFIDTNNSIYRPEDFSFGIAVDRFAGLADEITVRGQIEDEHGEVMRTYAPWTNVTVTSDRRQSYTPNLPTGVYQVSFWFENPPCLDLDPAAYRVTKLIAISPSYQRSSSALTINELNLGSDNKAKWGEQFTVKATVYRGNISKSAVEWRVEKEGKIASGKTKVNAPQQFTEYSFMIPLQLIPNCDEEISSGTAVLMAEGLGTAAQQEFEIKGVDKDICTDYLDYIEEREEEANKLSYSVSGLPAAVAPGEAFRITAAIDNEGRPHTFLVWAYLYRGNACYSCAGGERDENKEEVRLGADENKKVELLLKADNDLGEGEYKIKVLFNKDNQKTSKEMVEKLYVREERKEMNSSLAALAEYREAAGSSARSRLTTAAAGIVVYESNEVRSRKVTPYLLLGAAVLMLVVMWKKNDNP